MNYILGSGLVGLVAKWILGDDWTLIPFGKSRFYSFSLPLAENYIIRDERVDEMFANFGGMNPIIQKLTYSFSGELHEHSNVLAESWAWKVFNQCPPTHIIPYLQARKNFFVYKITAHELHRKLQEQYLSSIQAEVRKGPITKIEDHKITYYNGQVVDYGRIISTIPLTELNRLCGYQVNLPSKQIWYHAIDSPAIQLEGSCDVLVVDDIIEFFRVSNIGGCTHLFQSLIDVPLPGPYYSRFFRPLDIIDGTTIQVALPLGPNPNLNIYEKSDITCIGALAEWDWCRDISSAFLKLLNFKYNQSTIKSYPPSALPKQF